MARHLLCAPFSWSHLILMRRSPKSPLSAIQPQKLYDLPRSFLISKLSDYFQSRCPPRAVTCDYSIWRCAKTGLEFAWPPVPGNKVFYEWISQFPSYYPNARWEYAEALSQIRARGISDFSVLDVGCGSGRFLDSVRSQRPRRLLGVDLNQSAIHACHAQGLDAFCGSLQSALKRKVASHHEFDFVASFHCLEHVPNPRAFLGELLRFVSHSGRVFISTPYSPMSFESEWFDVMNHPPHHMTRWNLLAYRQLANSLGLSFAWSAPTPSTLRQAFFTEKLSFGGPRAHAALPDHQLRFLNRWRSFLRIWRVLRDRNSTHPLKGADVILVAFSYK